MPGVRGKQSVKNGIWKIGGRIRKQRGGAIPIGLIASLAAPAFKTIFGRGRVRRQRGKRVGSTIAKNGINLGTKKIINKTIDNMPNMFKFGVSKIKNNDIKNAMTTEIANMIIDEAQNIARRKHRTLFEL